MKYLYEPIITHLTDTDVYKFYMMYLAWKKRRGTPVVYGMNNRTRSVRLAEIIPEGAIREQLDHVMTLRFKPQELNYLEGSRLEDGTPVFSKEFVREHLANFRLPEYELKKNDVGQYDLRFPGPWEDAILWETMGMGVVNQLRNFYTLQATGKNMSDLYDEGRRRRDEKIDRLNGYPFLRFMEFGTRRRFCFDWLDDTIAALKSGLKYGQMMGTSNVWLSLKYNLKMMGTQAHELYMAYMRLFGLNRSAIFGSQVRVLEDWWELFGHTLSIALTDTVGSDFFFRMMPREMVLAWKGLRQDSGDPFVYGRKAIRFYQQHEVDPKSKILVFSDGLDLDLMFRLYDCFARFIQVVFGWGTNLSNDLGLDPISLVIKLIRVLGLDTVKLPDNLAKATGSAEDIAFAKELFGYTGSDRVECRY